MGNPAPTGSIAALGCGSTTATGYPTFRVGNPNGSLLRWDGTSLLVREAGLTIDTAGLSLAASEPMVLDRRRPQALRRPAGDSVSLPGATHGLDCVLADDPRQCRHAAIVNPQCAVMGGAGNRLEIRAKYGLALGLAGTDIGVGLDASGFIPFTDAALTLGSLEDRRWSNIWLDLPPAAAAPAYVVVQGSNNQDLAYVAPVVNAVINGWSSTTNAPCLMTFRAGILTSTTCPP